MRWSSNKLSGTDKADIEALKSSVASLETALDAREIEDAHLLPTSDRDLSSGKLWNDRGTVKIKS